MSDTGRSKRLIAYKESSNSKSWKLEKQRPNWLDLPRHMVECIFGRLFRADRIRFRAVCKAWSVLDLYIPGPSIIRVPWGMTSFWWRAAYNGQIYGNCRLLDPFSREYNLKKASVRGLECRLFLQVIPCASVYGWALFRTSFKIKSQMPFILYSPFTAEIIKLPETGKSHTFYQVATFSLNATSRKFVIFLSGTIGHKIYISICSPGDYSWKTFEFNNGFDEINKAVDATYANGVFYCVFETGQLGAFNAELEEWNILVDHSLPEFRSRNAKLIASDADLLLLDQFDSESFKLFKFDFSKTRWIDSNNLDNHVLFIGCTSFSAPAVGELSQLANTIFFCHLKRRLVRCYGRTLRSCRESQIFRKCSETTVRAMTWIQLPLGGIWRANDLINGSKISIF